MWEMELTIKGEAVVTWRSQASFVKMMMMMPTRLLYLAVRTAGVAILSQRWIVTMKKSGH